MRRILPLLFLLSVIGLAHAEVSVSQSNTQEIADLKARVKALQQENELLRSMLGNNAPPSTTPPASADKPILGVEGLVSEMPSNGLPNGDEAAKDLRKSLLDKWVQAHAIGRTLNVRAKFAAASAISGGTFEVKLASLASATRPFEILFSLPESDAPKIADMRRGAGIEASGQIAEIRTNLTDKGSFTISIRLTHVVLNGGDRPDNPDNK